MQRNLTSGSVALILLVGLLVLSGMAQGQCCRSGEFYTLKLPCSTTWCCPSACTEAQILGWRVADICGRTIHSVAYAIPVPVSAWRVTWPQPDPTPVVQAAAQARAGDAESVYESWQQVKSAFVQFYDSTAMRVHPGCYTLFVDTTVGTVSRGICLACPVSCCHWKCCFGY
ncbi:MAG TPA: hypothetical protein VMX15_02305 [Candidatus Heimdallarchaeota archaeon]|nr:hypothetical protein [Candidatus Heimdallarchaeota archaeon]